MAVSNFDTIRANAFLGIGAGIPGTTGNTWYVSSVSGSSGNDGQSPGTPKATIAQAIAAATASNGDIIICLPGHAETLSAAAGIALSKAGIYIYGIGEGSLRPTISSATDTAATMTVSAANVILDNFLFVCGIDSQVIMLDVNINDFTVRNCEFRNVTAAQMLTAIDINGGSANVCDRVKVQNCLFRMSAVGSARAIELGEVADGVEISGCVVWGDFDDACIHNPTGKVLTNLTVKDCILTNLQTGDHSIELVSACTGNLVRNMYHNDMTQATGVDPGSCFSFQCFHDDVIDTSAILCPVAT